MSTPSSLLARVPVLLALPLAVACSSAPASDPPAAESVGQGSAAATRCAAPLLSPLQVGPGVGAAPSGVAIADFDLDGVGDVAVSVSNAGTVNQVSVSLGAGGGALGPATGYPVAFSPMAVVAADFNADGKPDLATANLNSGDNVSVLLGHGDGTFATQVGYLPGLGAWALAAADVDADGRVDLVVVDPGVEPRKGTARILLGNGDGTFRVGGSFATGYHSHGVAVGDLDGDGHLDLAVASVGNSQPRLPSSVDVLLGKGDGTFLPAVTLTIGKQPGAIVAADFNADGALDLAVADNGAAFVRLVLGHGDGTFGPAASYAAGSEPWALAALDFNRDGHVDLAIANAGFNAPGSVSLLLGRGDGTLRPQTAHASGIHPAALASGDLDGDGAVDLALPDGAANTVDELLGTCD